MIVVVFGLPGSGKSYFASRLARLLKAEYINSDIARKKMFYKRTYTIEEKMIVYNKMREQMLEAIKHNKDVVLDATFYRNDMRQKFLEGRKNIDSVIFIEVRAEEYVVGKRLEGKRKDSEADFEVYKKIKTEWEPLTDEHLILESTDYNIQDMLEKTFDYLHFKK